VEASSEYRFSGAPPGAYRFVIESSPGYQSAARFDPCRTFLLVAEVGA
jgi:hypothetical protein